MNPLVLVAVALVLVAAVVLSLRGGRKPAVVGVLTQEYQPYRLEKKTQLTHNTWRFRFATGHAGRPLGLPTGNHVLLKFTETDAEGKQVDVSRQYTPVTSDDDLGHFELVIKTYPGGKMSNHLVSLPVGGTILCRGPQGSLRYNGSGRFVIKRRGVPVERPVRRVSMIAGGTGITPMLQIVQDVCKRVDDRTEIRLIFANVTEADILLREVLVAAAEKHPNFKVFFCLNECPAGWTGGSGFVTPDMIQKELFAPGPDTLMLVCGPPPMVRAMEGHLDKLGYTEDMRFFY